MSLIFDGILLAISAGIIIWQLRGSKKIDKPKETEDGKFSIPKPEDEFIEGVQYNEVREDIELNDIVYEGIKNPNGTPTGKPR